MIRKIEKKMKFLKKLLKELERDLDAQEGFSKDLLQTYAEEKLIYISQIRVLKQLLNENT